MLADTTSTLDAILEGVVRSRPGVPGVAAVATDRQGTIYRGGAGVRSIAGTAPFDADTVVSGFSTTKALTATACLQLVDEGLLDLDAPAADYVPALGRVEVLDRFDPDGSPVLRPPIRPITTRMLLLHTAGFGYPFFNDDQHRLARALEIPSTATGTLAALDSPLLFDPGERWEYGINLDWAGRVVEEIRGLRLGMALAEHLLDPLGMTSTSFALAPEWAERAATLHQRQPDGSIEISPLVLPAEPPADLGGGGIRTTADDYARFLRLWLNDGRGPDGPLLRPETVEMAVRDGLGGRGIHVLPGVVPALSNDVSIFPGVPKSWGLSFLINDEVAPTGRPAGSLAWAGLANLYYWIDRRNGVAGFWATQLLPFFDHTAVGGYLAFETAVYDGLV